MLLVWEWFGNLKKETGKNNNKDKIKENIKEDIKGNVNIKEKDANYKQMISTLKKEIEKSGIIGDKDLPSIKMWKNTLAFIDNSDINKAYKNVLDSGNILILFSFIELNLS